MLEEIRKRTVVNEIRQECREKRRKEGVEAPTEMTVRMRPKTYPAELGIGFHELGSVLLSLEQDGRYKEKITYETAGNDRDGSYHEITVRGSEFLPGKGPDKRPSVIRREGRRGRGKVIFSLGGKEAGYNQESLSGELLIALGSNWGIPMSKEHVLDLLEKRVKDERTRGRPTDIQIDDAIREINRKLSERQIRRIKLVGRKSSKLGMTWKLVLAIRKRKPRGLSAALLPTDIQKIQQ